MHSERPEDRYDHSAHSTRHEEKGDLGTPGQQEPAGTPQPADEKPDRVPKHRD